MDPSSRDRAKFDDLDWSILLIQYYNTWKVIMFLFSFYSGITTLTTWALANIVKILTAHVPGVGKSVL